MGTLEIVFNTITAICGVTGLAGGAVSWWMAHKSRQAKEDALKAKEQAQKSADSLEAMAAFLQPPPLALYPLRKGKNVAGWYLYNRTSQPITLEEVTNANNVGFDLQLPLTLKPFTGVKFTRYPAAGSDLILEMRTNHDTPYTLFFDYW